MGVLRAAVVFEVADESSCAPPWLVSSHKRLLREKRDESIRSTSWVFSYEKSSPMGVRGRGE